jgi:hypothetical protein
MRSFDDVLRLRYLCGYSADENGRETIAARRLLTIEWSAARGSHTLEQTLRMMEHTYAE